jgi:hypothetical protein
VHPASVGGRDQPAHCVQVPAKPRLR